MSCMKEFVEVIQGAGRYPIEPLLKGIGGQICREKHRSMSKSVISAKGLLQTSINQGGT